MWPCLHRHGGKPAWPQNRFIVAPKVLQRVVQRSERSDLIQLSAPYYIQTVMDEVSVSFDKPLLLILALSSFAVSML